MSEEKKVFTEKDLHELLKPLGDAFHNLLEERDETNRLMEEDYD